MGSGKKSQVIVVMHWDVRTLSLSYLPTPPLGQDMTQRQFLSGV